MPAYLLLLVAVLSRLLPHAGWMELYRGGRRAALLWRAAAVAGDAGAAGRAHGYRLLAHRLLLPLRFPVAVLRGHLGVVSDGHGSGVYSAAGADDLCAGGGGRAAGADLVFPALELMRLGRAAWLIPIRTRWAAWARAMLAGLPFYRNDLLSTAIVAGLAFGLPVLVRRMSATRAQVALAGK